MNLFDFDQAIYGERIDVEMVARIGRSKSLNRWMHSKLKLRVMQIPPRYFGSDS